MAKQTVHKGMRVSEVVERYPQLIETMLELGMPCVGCQVAIRETVEQAAQAHGIEPNGLVRKLNERLEVG